MVFSRYGSSALTGFKLRASWSLLPEKPGLQAWATSTQLKGIILSSWFQRSQPTDLGSVDSGPEMKQNIMAAGRSEKQRDWAWPSKAPAHEPLPLARPHSQSFHHLPKQWGISYSNHNDMHENHTWKGSKKSVFVYHLCNNERQDQALYISSCS
jgi:hypothetical protein